MSYLDCPSCRLRIHSGVLYAASSTCPRCGAPFHPPRPSLFERASWLVFHDRRPVAQAPDWEEITRAQYVDRRYVTREEPPIPQDGGAATA